MILLYRDSNLFSLSLSLLQKYSSRLADLVRRRLLRMNGTQFMSWNASARDGVLNVALQRNRRVVRSFWPRLHCFILGQRVRCILARFARWNVASAVLHSTAATINTLKCSFYRLCSFTVRVQLWFNNFSHGATRTRLSSLMIRSWIYFADQLWNRKNPLDVPKVRTINRTPAIFDKFRFISTHVLSIVLINIFSFGRAVYH